MASSVQLAGCTIGLLFPQEPRLHQSGVALGALPRRLSRHTLNHNQLPAPPCPTCPQIDPDVAFRSRLRRVEVDLQTGVLVSGSWGGVGVGGVWRHRVGGSMAVLARLAWVG